MLATIYLDHKVQPLGAHSLVLEQWIVLLNPGAERLESSLTKLLKVWSLRQHVWSLVCLTIFQILDSINNFEFSQEKRDNIITNIICIELTVIARSSNRRFFFLYFRIPETPSDYEVWLLFLNQYLRINPPPNSVERKWVQSIFYPWEFMTQYIYAARGVWYAINPKGIYRHIQYAYFYASKIIIFPL